MPRTPAVAVCSPGLRALDAALEVIGRFAMANPVLAQSLAWISSCTGSRR